LHPLTGVIRLWSLGGLAVVRALFTEPTAYRSFIADSPSLWYDGGSVLDGEKQFAADVTSGRIAPRVLIAVGARESLTMHFLRSL
jgi:predicted alpha/beta superfamily hydrolase